LSSFRNRALAADAVLLGELGLSGEVRAVGQAHLRIREAVAMGFHRCILPAGNLPLVDPVPGSELISIKMVGELPGLAL
jgi:DNA repair protein RadA/Sms